MALRIELPSGQIVMVDELSGDILPGDLPPDYQPAPPGSVPPGGFAGPSQVGATPTDATSQLLPPAPGTGDLPAPPPGYIWDPASIIANEPKLITDRTFQGGGGADGGLSQNTLYTQQQQNQRTDAALAEQIRQYNESFGADKAKFNMGFAEDQRQFNERLGFDNQQLDVRRGETLLNLGSRPDTLIRYLFALRGQQAPQGLAQGPSIPGFSNVPQAPAPATQTTAPAIAAAPAPVSAPAPQLVQTDRGVFDPGSATAPAQRVSTSVPTPTPSTTAAPPLTAGQLAYARGLSGSGFSGPINEAAINDYIKRGGTQSFADGGVIPEPVDGIGRHSGQMYEFGEEGPEVVVPQKKVPKDIFQMLMDDAEEVDYSEDKMGKRHVKVKRGMNSYADGGVIGFDPKLFNPPSIRNEFSFPQIPNFTGGTSLVPSAQRLFEALPSERALYAGYLQDEQGVQSDDVFEMARRLAPQVTGLQAGRFTN